MSELSVLERVRAAVAEAGYDPSAVMPGHDNFAVTWWTNEIPDYVMWRAKETVGIGAYRCFGCNRDDGPCLADRRFVEDCGRDRGDP